MTLFLHYSTLPIKPLKLAMSMHFNPVLFGGEGGRGAPLPTGLYIDSDLSELKLSK